MAKYNTVMLERNYGTCIAFENLTPQEVGQLTHLLGKATQVDEKYVGGDIGYQCTRRPERIKVNLIGEDIIVNPSAPEEPTEE